MQLKPDTSIRGHSSVQFNHINNISYIYWSTEKKIKERKKLPSSNKVTLATIWPHYFSYEKKWKKNRYKWKEKKNKLYKWNLFLFLKKLLSKFHLFRWYQIDQMMEVRMQLVLSEYLWVVYMMSSSYIEVGVYL